MITIFKDKVIIKIYIQVMFLKYITNAGVCVCVKQKAEVLITSSEVFVIIQYL